MRSELLGAASIPQPLGEWLRRCGPVCYPRRFSREVSCLLGAIVHDIKMLLGMVKVKDCCPFLLFQFIHIRLQ